MGMTQGVMVGVVAGFGFASLAHGQVLEIEREVSAEAGAQVAGDPVRDSERISTMDVGVFDGSAAAQAEIPPLVSNRSLAIQRSEYVPNFVLGEDSIIATGSAVARLLVDGRGDASAQSFVTIRFEVMEESLFTIQRFDLFVDDQFGPDLSQDRPGDASASVVLTNTDTGEDVFGVEVVLDDAGTFNRERGGGTSYQLPAGQYVLRAEAVAIDQTDGIEVVQDSLSAATFQLIARISFPVPIPDCPADFDFDGVLTFYDYLAFLSFYDTGDLRADVDRDGVLTIKDFLVFQNMFDAGCP